MYFVLTHNGMHGGSWVVATAHCEESKASNETNQTQN